MKHLAAAACVLFMAPAPEKINARFESPDGPLIVRNGVHFTSKIEGDNYSFDGTGDPVYFDRPAQGTVISGLHVTGSVQQGADGNYDLKQASFIGKARLVRDTGVADDYLTAAKKPLPMRKLKDRSELDSERFDYAGAETEGTLTLPGAFTLEDVSSGTKPVTKKVKGVDVKGDEAFTETFNLDGSSGTIIIDPRPGVAEKTRPQKGDIKGPVNFHLKRDAKGPGDLAFVTSKLDGVADSLSFDFTGATRTITAEGHVNITTDRAPFTGNFTSDKTVITVDENMKILSIESTGDPTTSKLHKIGGER